MLMLMITFLLIMPRRYATCCFYAMISYSDMPILLLRLRYAMVCLAFSLYCADVAMLAVIC